MIRVRVSCRSAISASSFIDVIHFLRFECRQRPISRYVDARGRENDGYEIARHEIAGRQIAGHDNAGHEQEAQLSPSDRAMRLVSSNLANYHATVQKLLIRQVLTMNGGAKCTRSGTAVLQ